jgi:hypothetical protein
MPAIATTAAQMPMPRAVSVREGRPAVVAAPNVRAQSAAEWRCLINHLRVVNEQGVRHFDFRGLCAAKRFNKEPT